MIYVASELQNGFEKTRAHIDVASPFGDTGQDSFGALVLSQVDVRLEQLVGKVHGILDLAHLFVVLELLGKVSLETLDRQRQRAIRFCPDLA